MQRFGPQSSANLRLVQNVFSLSNDLVHTRGRHTLKAGGLKAPSRADPQAVRLLTVHGAGDHGFVAALVDVAALPGLSEHGCSYREPGGFIRRMREGEGTWLGHVLEHAETIGTYMKAAGGRR